MALFFKSTNLESFSGIVVLCAQWAVSNAYICAATAVLVLGAVYGLSLTIHRLVFSPIAKFPGPKIAAATGWYEFYYDAIKKGKYLFEIEKMHEQYGPIVRINPFELSIRDNDFYDKVYVSSAVRPSESYPGFMRGLGWEGSHLLTPSHELHRQRRKPLERFFSRTGVQDLEPMLADLAEKLVVTRLESFAGTDEVIRLDHAFFAFAADVITRVCVLDPPDLIDDPRFAPEYFDVFGFVQSLPVILGFPWLVPLIRSIPQIILDMWPYAPTRSLNNFKQMCESHLDTASKSQGEHNTVFRTLIQSKLPPSELTKDRLVMEAQVLLAAGALTTGAALTFICFHVQTNPAIRTRLMHELEETMAGYPRVKPTWAQLERVTYLQAVIKEALRLSYGSMHRLPRVSPMQALQYKEWTIPAGVPVGMSAYFQHSNPDIFPQPFDFIPERWLPENVTPEMTRSFVTFSKGSRNCLGMSLVYCELNLVIAAMFRPGGPDFTFYESDVSDVEPVHDLVLPLPRMDSKGARVQFH